MRALARWWPTGAPQISSSGQVAFANVTLSKEAIKITTGEAKKFVDTPRLLAEDTAA